MALPKLYKPTYKFTIPSLNKQVTYRPFLVKEEKILLTAAEGQDVNEVLDAVLQVVNNCIQDDIDIYNLSPFDIELFFIHLRSKSVSNIVKIKVLDESVETDDDNPTYIETEVNLDEVVIRGLSARPPLITINNTTSIQLRYPKIDFAKKIKIGDSEVQNRHETLKYLMDKLYVGNEVFPFNDETEEEIDEFIDSLPVPVLEQVEKFIDDLPYVYYSKEYTNGAGQTKTVELTKLTDFFTLL